MGGRPPEDPPRNTRPDAADGGRDGAKGEERGICEGCVPGENRSDLGRSLRGGHPPKGFATLPTCLVP